MSTRDMSEKQFRAALERHRMKREGIMGYVDLGIDGEHISVSRYNAGRIRRNQLAYLLQKRDEYERKLDAEGGAL